MPAWRPLQKSLACATGASLWLAVSWLGASLPASAATVERVVAVVGDQAILLTDLKERSRPFLFRVHEQFPDGPQRAAAISQVYKVVLERMVEEQLEDGAAKRAGIAVTPEEVTSALDRVATQNGMTPLAILKEAQLSGMSSEQYREELKRQVLQAKIGNLRLQGRIHIDDSDLHAAYRKLVREERLQLPTRTLRLVLPIGTSAREQAAAQRLADDISLKARAGASFQDLLTRHGAPGSGAFPARAPQEEAEPIQRATLGLEVGEVSRPVRVGETLLIVQVVERGASSLPAYDVAKDAVHERLHMEKLARVRKTWLDGLRRRTHVELRM